jgi:hypothetical protein
MGWVWGIFVRAEGKYGASIRVLCPLAANRKACRNFSAEFFLFFDNVLVRNTAPKSVSIHMKKHHLPLMGILASVCLFVIAASYYPGGTADDPDFVGYDWTRHFISTLFHATALNGADNTARYYATPAMLLLCISLGVVFKNIAGKGQTKRRKDTIEIGGIGSMVYTFLSVVMPIHDLLVTIALLFFLPALFAILKMLSVERKFPLLYAGFGCLAVVLVCSVMYYGNVFFNLLPIAQKLTFFFCTGWLLMLYFAGLKPNGAASKA